MTPLTTMVPPAISPPVRATTLPSIMRTPLFMCIPGMVLTLPLMTIFPPPMYSAISFPTFP